MRERLTCAAIVAALLGPIVAEAVTIPTVIINPTQRVQIDLCAIMSDGQTECQIAPGWQSPNKLRSSSPAVSVRPITATLIEIDPLQDIFAPGLGKFTATIYAKAANGRGGTVENAVLKVVIDPAAPDEPSVVGVKAGMITVFKEVAQ